MQALARVAPVALTLGLLVGAFLLTGSRLSVDVVLAKLGRLSPASATGAFVCFTLGYTGAGLRLRHLLRRSSAVRVGAAEMLGLTEATYLTSYAAPVALVSDVLRVGYLRVGLNIGLKRAMPIVLYDRVLGMAGVAIVGLLALPLQLAAHLPLSFVALQGSCWLAMLAAFAATPHLARALGKTIGNFQFLETFAAISQAHNSSWRDMSLQAMFAFLAVGGFGLAIVLLAGTIAPSVPALWLLSLSALVLFVQNLPFVYAGWGAREGAFIMLAALVPGLDPNALLALSLAVGAGLLVSAAPGALFFVLSLGRKLHLQWRKPRVDATQPPNK